MTPLTSQLSLAICAIQACAFHSHDMWVFKTGTRNEEQLGLLLINGVSETEAWEATERLMAFHEYQ